jgi:hypothetical protein
MVPGNTKHALLAHNTKIAELVKFTITIVVGVRELDALLLKVYQQIALCLTLVVCKL